MGRCQVIKGVSPAKVRDNMWQEGANAHILKEYPKEACGFILKDDTFAPAKNIHKNPLHHFEISQREYARNLSNIKAVVHSHCEGGLILSDDDIINQHSSGLPWVMILTDGRRCEDPVWFGEQVIRKKYLGLGFIYGANDCYSLIRNYYYDTRGVCLPNFPRVHDWWNAPGGSMYENFYPKAGFTRLGSLNSLEEGDILLMRIGRTRCLNHASVFLGDCGKIVHHMQDRLSTKEHYAHYALKIEVAYRFDKDCDLVKTFKKRAEGVILI